MYNKENSVSTTFVPIGKNIRAKGGGNFVRQIRRWSMMLVIGVGIVCSGCTGYTGDSAVERSVVRVTATTGMVADLVRQVGGEHVRVAQVIPVGVDPHTYRATQADLRKLSDAQLIVYNGLHLEGRMIEVFDQMASSKTIVDLGARLDQDQLLRAEESGGVQTFDPHIWFDVALWSRTVAIVRDALIRVDPTHRVAYERQAQAYETTLQALHEEVRQMLATVPPEQRVLVTAHDAFRYFGRTYGVEVHGLQGINTNSEAGSQDVIALRDFLIERDVRAVFIETSVSPKAIEAVIAGAKALGHDVRSGGSLYSDALGEVGSDAETYVGMVRHNVRLLMEAWKR